jgi:hypothetical protein
VRCDHRACAGVGRQGENIEAASGIEQTHATESTASLSDRNIPCREGLPASSISYRVVVLLGSTRWSIPASETLHYALPLMQYAAGSWGSTLGVGVNNNGTVRTAAPGRAWVRPYSCGPDGQNCVELNVAHPGQVRIRDSKSRRVLMFEPRAWRAFLGSLGLARLA